MANHPQGLHAARQTKQATASGWVGSALEYYDFFIYAQAAALIFPQIFSATGRQCYWWCCAWSRALPWPGNSPAPAR
ncbi:hypothetical protein ABIE20_004055 [Pseudomonas sp. 2835]